MGKPTAALFLLLASALLSSPSSGQLGCSTNPELALLDFWFGEWRVEDDGWEAGFRGIYKPINAGRR